MHFFFIAGSCRFKMLGIGTDSQRKTLRFLRSPTTGHNAKRFGDVMMELRLLHTLVQIYFRINTGLILFQMLPYLSAFYLGPPNSNSEGEKAFSPNWPLLKNDLLSIMAEEQSSLVSLCVLCTERDLLREMSFDYFICEFVDKHQKEIVITSKIYWSSFIFISCLGS